MLEPFIIGEKRKVTGWSFDGNPVVKLYPSPDFTKFRLFLPELVSFAQVKIDTEQHFIEVIRSEAAARKLVRELTRKVSGF